jgi:hypothetical protein
MLARWCLLCFRYRTVLQKRVRVEHGGLALCQGRFVLISITQADPTPLVQPLAGWPCAWVHTREPLQRDGAPTARLDPTEVIALTEAHIRARTLHR